MKESLEILQNIKQANEPANLDFLDSPDITKTANQLSELVQPCIKEIIESATNIKNSLELGLKTLNFTEKLINNYRQNSAESSSYKTIEEIGKSTGYCIKICQFIDCSREEVNQKFKEIWVKEFNLLNNKCFVNGEKKYKKGLGWDEKNSFIQGLKKINSECIITLSQECKKSLESVFKLIEKFLSNEKIDYCLNFLNVKQVNIYQQKIEFLIEKIVPPTHLIEFDKFYNDSKTKNKLILDPIFNCTWGDLAWNLVAQTQRQYRQELEKTIDDFFENQKKVVNNFFVLIMQIYNDILEKQEFYQKETQEELQARQQWIDTQKAKLLAIQTLLDDALSFKA